MASKTIAQFARKYGLKTADVKKAARQRLHKPGGRVGDADYALDGAEQRILARHFGVERAEAPSAPLAVEPEPEPEPALEFRSDPPTPLASLRFEPDGRRVFVHGDVLNGIQRRPRFARSLSLRLAHLAAHGVTSHTKGCADPDNRGWRRTAFGGNNGMQYYLWWTEQGHRPVKALGGEAGDIFVRAVRHHDDHKPLAAGGWDDYLRVGPAEVEDDAYIGPPWTVDQVRFIEASDPVRFVQGRPGSGKTTVLWRALETRADQRVLYLSWSRELVSVARQRFAVFAPVGVGVETLDHVTLLGELTGSDPVRIRLPESRRRFFRALGPAFDLGGWQGHEAALFAEVRAMLVGRAVPGAEGVEVRDGLPRLSEEATIALRGREVQRSMARDAARALARLTGDAPARVFPELVAAAAAIERLRADELPPGYEAFDRIVVDEVQDLTLLDAAVVVELCRAIGRARGHAPWLLVAGDDGQTVRPSGFDWGPLSNLVTDKLHPPRDFRLEENLRSPARIAAVVQRASEMYGTLAKRHRPTKQSRDERGQHAEAFLYHVDASTTAAARELIADLDDADDPGLILLSPRAERPGWLPVELHDAVRTPAEAKGLEYQSVVVIDPGGFMRATLREARDQTHGPFAQAVRTRIDQFRVALSRATETLAFLDVAADHDAHHASRTLLGDPVPCDPQDLLEHFTDADILPEDRVRRRMDDARALVESNPRRAWRRASQAALLLGDPSLPNGVASADLRRAARLTLLATGARLLVDGLPERVNRVDVVAAMHATVGEMEAPGHRAAADALDEWTAERAASPVELFEATLALGGEGEWIRASLAPVHQRLRGQIRALAERPDGANARRADIGPWLPLTGFRGDVAAEVRRLRCRGVETLLSADDLGGAEAVAAGIAPEAPAITAKLHAARERHADAAGAFERAGMPADAYRQWRLAGDWDRALRLADADPAAVGRPAETDELAWLSALRVLIQRRPSGHDARLTPGERERIQRLLRSVDPG